MSEFKSTWISLTDALSHASNIIGEEEAWPQVKQAIIDKVLSARGVCDGVLGELNGNWLSILSWDDPENDTLWFNDKRFRLTPNAPSRIERMEVDGNKVRELWEASPSQMQVNMDIPEVDDKGVRPKSKIEIEENFNLWAKEEKQKLGRPINRDEAEKWAMDKGISRDRGRDLYKMLPPNLRRKRGKPPKT
ncbi:MAG: hypothetical protein HOC57_03500 [Rhodospirillaceae bacterium]|nr:hypothetical protein [Rhodospirillaceae bacterium]MBT4588324.1 hypothetical protein [Rhodospirillaceae bacterium]